MKSITLIPMLLTLVATSTASAAQSNETITAAVPTLEIRSNYSDVQGNVIAIDDPTIWMLPTNKRKSLVITSLKKDGIDIYDLQGELTKFIEPTPSTNTESVCKSSAAVCETIKLIMNNVWRM